jgi:hypothetical protein
MNWFNQSWSWRLCLGSTLLSLVSVQTFCIDPPEDVFGAEVRTGAMVAVVVGGVGGLTRAMAGQVRSKSRKGQPPGSHTTCSGIAPPGTLICIGKKTGEWRGVYSHILLKLMCWTPTYSCCEPRALWFQRKGFLIGLCKIWGFHGRDYVEWCLLGCYAVWLLYEPMFRRNLAPPSSRWQESAN